MRRLILSVAFCFFCLFGRADLTNDVSNILSRLQSVYTQLRNLNSEFEGFRTNYDYNNDEIIIPDLDDIAEYVEQIKIKINLVQADLNDIANTILPQSLYYQNDIDSMLTLTVQQLEDMRVDLNQCTLDVHDISQSLSSVANALADVYNQLSNLNDEFSGSGNDIHDIRNFQEGIYDAMGTIVNSIHAIAQSNEDLAAIRAWLEFEGNMLVSKVDDIKQYTFQIDSYLFDWRNTGVSPWSGLFYGLEGAPWLTGLQADMPETVQNLFTVGNTQHGYLSDIADICSSILKGEASNNELLLYISMALTKSNLNPENNEDIQSKETDFQSGLSAYEADARSAQETIDGLSFEPLDVGSAFNADKYTQTLRPYARSSLDVNTLTLGGFGTFNGLQDITATLDLGSFTTFFSGVRFAFGVIYWGLLVGFLVFVFRWFCKIQKMLWSFLYNY